MLLSFTVLAVAMTFAGGCLPWVRSALSREGMSRLFSLRAGILLGVAFTEIMPEAWAQNHALAGWAALLAFSALFGIGQYAMLDSCPEYLAQCRIHYLSWAGFLALGGHSFVDGFNLPVAFSAGRGAGVAVGLALALHKIADGLTLTSVFQQSGYSRRRSLWGLAAIASATPIGCFASFKGLAILSASASAGLLGFAAGSFIYIAAADTLPRLHRERDRSGLLYFGLGMTGMAALKIL